LKSKEAEKEAKKNKEINLKKNEYGFIYSKRINKFNNLIKLN